MRFMGLGALDSSQQAASAATAQALMTRILSGMGVTNQEIQQAARDYSANPNARLDESGIRDDYQFRVAVYTLAGNHGGRPAMTIAGNRIQAMGGIVADESTIHWPVDQGYGLKQSAVGGIPNWLLYGGAALAVVALLARRR